MTRSSRSGCWRAWLRGSWHRPYNWRIWESFTDVRGQLARARDTLERAASEGAPAVDTLSELARIAYQQQDREGALGYLAHARDLDPKRAGIHFFFGI